MTSPLNPQHFKKNEITRLKQENADLQEEVDALRQFVQGLDELYNASDNFVDDSELFPFLKNTLTHAMKVLNAPDGSLALLDDESDELVFVIVNGTLSKQLTDHRMSAKQGIAGWVAQNAKPALVRNVQTDPRFYKQIDRTFTFQTQSIAAAPLVGDRKVFGVVEVLNQPGYEPFSHQDVALLKLFCRAAGEALANIDRMPTAPKAD